MVIEYEARIKELQEEIDLDDEAFKNKLIDKLKSQVGEQRQLTALPWRLLARRRLAPPCRR